MKPGSSTIATALLLLLLICGCGAPGVGSSSRSIAEAEARGILTVEYAIPTHAEIGGYRPLEVWIEDPRRLVVRLKRPHVDSEPRVNVCGLMEHDYRSGLNVTDRHTRSGWPRILSRRPSFWNAETNSSNLIVADNSRVRT